MTEDSSFWSRANGPRTPAEALQRARRIAASPAPREPSGDIAAADPIETVAAMSQAEYAAARDEIMASHGGPRASSEWMGGVDLPAGRAGLALSPEQVAALLPHRSLGEKPTAGRVLDRAYAEAAQAAAAQTSLAVPTRYTNPER